MNRKKLMGFTLIELLAVIAILGVILSISLYAFSFSTDNVNEEVDEINKNALLSAANIYFNEFSHNGNWNSYTIKEDGVDTTYSCVSLYNLINSGIYDTSNTYTKEMLDNVAVKIKTVNGVSTYEYIDNYNTDSDCTYWVVGDEIGNIDMDITTGETGTNEVAVLPTIDNNGDGTYTLKLRFTADKKVIQETYTFPVYVLILLDKSGSMRSNDRNRDAIKAISNMVNDIYTIDNSYIGFIDFGYSANYFSSSGNIWVNNSYQNQLLSYINDVPYVNGCDNNYYDAYTTAINNYGILDKGNQFTYVVLLSDAGNNNDGSTCISSAQKDNVASRIRSSVEKFIAVAYSPATTCLSTLASSNCPDNGGSCYYLSNSSQIASLFDNISNSIIENVMSQRVNQSKVKIDFTNKITLYDSNGNVISNDLNIDFNLNDTTSDIYVKEVEYTFKVNEVSDEEFTCNYEDKVCTYNNTLFEGFEIELYDSENNLIETLAPSELPGFTITKTLKSYMN